MPRRLIAATLVAVGSAALPAVAQDVTFTLVEQFDISTLTSTASPAHIGKNPVSIAWDGSSLFVGGFEGTGLGATTQIAEIVNFRDGSGSWTVRPVGGSSAATPALRGRPGLDWDPALGLLATLDLGNDTSPGQIQTFVRANSGDPLALDQSSASGSGVAGPSWDHGPSGVGFLRSDQSTGPVAGILDYRERTPIGLLGPIGLDPIDLGQLYFVQADDATSTVYGGGGPDISIDGTSDTLWRDVDFNPDGGIAARVTQDLVIAERDASNLQTSVIKVEDPTDQALLSGNNVAWVYDVPCLAEDVIVWNDRGPGCLGTLTDAVRLSARDGSPLTYSIVDGVGDEITAWPSNNCVYDYAWDAANQLLFIVESTTKTVYVLRPDCGEEPCAADVNGDGFVDNGDIGAFVTLFLAADLAADFNGDGFLDNGDIGSYITEFLAGCP